MQSVCNEEGGKELVEQYHRMVFDRILAHRIPRHLHDDAYQEGIQAASTAVRTHDPKKGSKRTAWVWRGIDYAIRSFLWKEVIIERRFKIISIDKLADSNQWKEIVSDESTQFGCNLKELREAMETVFQKVLDSEELVVVRARLDNKTYKQIAAETGNSAEGIRLKLLRIYDKVRPALKRILI